MCRSISASGFRRIVVINKKDYVAKTPLGKKGFEEITEGGLPNHRTTLVSGNVPVVNALQPLGKFLVIQNIVLK